MWNYGEIGPSPAIVVGIVGISIIFYDNYWFIVSLSWQILRIYN